MEYKGLMIKKVKDQYILCTGKPNKWEELKEGEIYIGDIIGWFESWEDANIMKKIIDECYPPCDYVENNI
jgi:hypothetical protein